MIQRHVYSVTAAELIQLLQLRHPNEIAGEIDISRETRFNGDTQQRIDFKASGSIAIPDYEPYLWRKAEG